MFKLLDAQQAHYRVVLPVQVRHGVKKSELVRAEEDLRRAPWRLKVLEEVTHVSADAIHDFRGAAEEFFCR